MRGEVDVLKWFGHAERMSRERITMRVNISEVEETGKRGKPERKWEYRVKVALKVQA